MRGGPLGPNRRVAVVGDYMLDAYVNGSVRRVCPDAPAPVLDADDELWAPGGAGNVAVGCTAHGLEVVACGFTGNDPEARTLETLLAEAGVGLDGLVTTPDRSTLVKRRFCCDDHVLLRVDRGSVSSVADLRVSMLAPAIRRAGAIVVSDYGYGSVTHAVRRLIATTRSAEDVPLVVDAKRLTDYRALAPDLVKPNYAQFCDALAAEPQQDRVNHVVAAADEFLEATGADSAVVTLDRDGCVAISPQGTFAIPAPPTPVHSTSGAGDSFLVALVAAWFSGAPLTEAAAYATRSATAACARRGTVSIARPAQEPAPPDRHKRLPPGRVGSWAQQLRAQGVRIVLTNGCFDIFHAGHAEFLQRAAEAGDALLVAVNTDDSVRALKGPGRPVNALEDRLRVLEAIGVVSAVTWFPDETAVSIARSVQPDVYVKGSDYIGRAFPEADLVRGYGGDVVFVDLVDGRSTSDIVNRVRAGSELAV